MTENSNGKGFVIKDKRMFDEEGGTRADADTVREDEKKEPAQKPETGNEKVERKETVKKEEERYQLPEMNFHNFVLSLYTSVLFNLGELADSVSDKKKKDLNAAKQTIDILGMVREKTEGNLDSSEKELLDGVLSESRMKYVKESENP
ncbi:MAG: DUF1844 domain-containing protein [Thermodesulfobacteriota bacterium]|nr:DUF1844 domain-containing protein [Thermodesulfobacteriota bacterium]